MSEGINIRLGATDHISPIFKDVQRMVGKTTLEIKDFQKQLNKGFNVNIKDTAFNSLDKTIHDATDEVDKFNTALKKSLEYAKNIDKAFDSVKSSLSNIKNKTVTVTVKQNNQSSGRSSNGGGGNQFFAGSGNTLFGRGGLDSIRGLLGAYAGFEGLSALVRTSDELTNITARIGLINDGAQTTKELMDMVFRSANRSRASFFSTAEAVARIGMNAGKAFGSTQELVGFAELLNKSFVIAGTKAEEMRSAMLQLSQGMASDRLQGDELRTIFEAAPIITKYIADYVGVSTGKIRELASEGKISAEVIKNAMFNASEDINKRFAEMPKTFTQVWTIFKNHAVLAWQPLYEAMRKFANSDVFTSFFNNIVVAMNGVAKVCILVVKAIELAFTALQKVWWALEPAVWGLVAAMAVYYGMAMKAVIADGLLTLAIKALYAWDIICAVAKMLFTKATWASVSATIASASAVWGLNAAMYANPVFWVVAGFIALVAIIFLAVNAYNKLTDSSVSAMGVIVGCVYAVVASFWNCIADIANLISSIIQWVLNAVGSACVSIKNAFVYGWTSWISSVKSAFYSFLSWLTDKLSWAIKLYDKLKGTNYAETLPKKYWDKSKGYAAERENLTMAKNTFTPFTFADGGVLPTKSLSDAYNKGYNATVDKISGFKGKLDNLTKYDDSQIKELMKKYNVNNRTDLAKALDENAEPTLSDKIGMGDTNDLIKKSNDLLGDLNKNVDSLDLTEYLKASVSRDISNRVTNVEVSVPVNMNNNVRNDRDLDGISNNFVKEVARAIQFAAEGAF